jgi:hypothetical protein
MPPWTYNNNSDNFDNLNAIPSYYDRHYSSTGTESNTDGCGDNYIIQEKYFPSRRPVLRPSVSEIRPTSSTSSFKKKLRPAYKYHPSNYYGNQPSDEEYAPLVRSRPPRRRKGTASHHGSHNSKKYVHL